MACCEICVRDEVATCNELHHQQLCMRLQAESDFQKKKANNA